MDLQTLLPTDKLPADVEVTWLDGQAVAVEFSDEDGRCYVAMVQDGELVVALDLDTEGEEDGGGTPIDAPEGEGTVVEMPTPERKAKAG